MLLLVLYFALIDMTVIPGYPQCVQQIHVKTMRLYKYGGWSEFSLDLNFVGFAVHRLISVVVHKFYQGWITHKARKVTNFKPNCRAYPSVDLIRLRDYGQDTIFVKGR